MENCVHHWMLETPDGPMSEGTCKKCGEKKEFSNSLYTGNWHTNNSLGARNKLSAAQRHQDSLARQQLRREENQYLEDSNSFV